MENFKLILLDFQILELLINFYPKTRVYVNKDVKKYMTMDCVHCSSSVILSKIPSQLFSFSSHS